jgi:hypothetical protein
MKPTRHELIASGKYICLWKHRLPSASQPRSCFPSPHRACTALPVLRPAVSPSLAGFLGCLLLLSSHLVTRDRLLVIADGTALALQAMRFACGAGGSTLWMRVAHALCNGAGSVRFLASPAHGAPKDDWAEAAASRSDLGVLPHPPARGRRPTFCRAAAWGREWHRQPDLARERFQPRSEYEMLF